MQPKNFEFIANNIDARASLERLGADDPKAFLDEVDAFCQNCLNEVYYSSEEYIVEYFSDRDYGSNYYSDDWNYDEYYSETEWAETFVKIKKVGFRFWIFSHRENEGTEITEKFYFYLSDR